MTNVTIRENVDRQMVGADISIEVTFRYGANVVALAEFRRAVKRVEEALGGEAA